MANAIIGDIYLGMKDTNKAESHYLESIKYYKDNSIPYCGLGSIYFSRRKYNKAFEMYEKQMDTHNYASNRYNNIDISLNLLTCYMIVENYESSIGFGEALRDIFTSKFDLSDRDILIILYVYNAYSLMHIFIVKITMNCYSKQMSYYHIFQEM